MICMCMPTRTYVVYVYFVYGPEASNAVIKNQIEKESS